MPASRKTLKLMLTGSNSRLAYRVWQEAERAEVSTIGIDLASGRFPHVPVDITRERDVSAFVQKEKPDVVIHTAALTDVDGCERDPERAFQINVAGTENVARACAKHGGRLIHLSTDYVFDGAAGPYGEEDQANPLSVYGSSKLESEQRCLATCPDALVVRTCVPYDWNPDCPPNFLMWLVQRLQQGAAVDVVDDQSNTPTFTPQLAQALVDLCRRDARGILHVSGSQFLSRYEFALKACKAFGYPPERVHPARTSALRQAARRPPRAGLRVQRAENLLGMKMLGADEGLQQARRLYQPRQG